MKENWVLNNKKADLKAICDSFGVSPVLAKLLVNKGYTEEAQIERFLNPSAADMHSYTLLKDMAKAVSLIAKAIDNGEQICIVGDYDVDGVVSTYLLMTALKELGAFVSFRIPDRIADGYGINISIIEKAIEEGCDLIVTCDNGIAAVDAIAYAKSQGLSVVVTDHHDVPEILPDADCIVNPKQKDCEYPFKGICGAVVAAKLCEGLFEKFGFGSFIEKHMDVLALATVCDVMELRDENRYIVKKGLSDLYSTENTGLRALIAETGLTGKKLTTYTLGFVLGPCLNATGRLESAVAGVALLASDDRHEAAGLASKLAELNETRKDMTLAATRKGSELVSGSTLRNDNVLVVYIPGCHESLAGIVAGRLREEFNRPSIVFTDSSANDEVLKGSGRSTDDYNMYEGLTEVRELLLKFGGHPKAAGLTISRDMLPELIRRLNQNCKEDLVNKPKKVVIDISIPLSGFNIELTRELDRLEPTGNGNEKPVFADRNVEILRLSRFGKDGSYLKIDVKDSRGGQACVKTFHDSEAFLDMLESAYGSSKVDAAFRGSETGMKVNMIYNPDINEYNGNVSVQYMLKNFSVPGSDGGNGSNSGNSGNGGNGSNGGNDGKNSPVGESNNCYIFGAADGIYYRINPGEKDTVIFCDGGLKYLDRITGGKMILLGDFDSALSEGLLAKEEIDGLTDGAKLNIKGHEMEIRRFPVKKDDTDTALAVKLALSEGHRMIYMYGCAGGNRPDHRLGNLGLLSLAAGYVLPDGTSAAAIMYDGNYCYTAIKGRKDETGKSTVLTIKDSIEGRFSVFARGRRAEGISLSGFEYNLRSGVLEPDSTLGASNMIKENSAHIMLDKGTVIVIAETKPENLFFSQT